MSTATARLLAEFEALPVEAKQEFVREVIHHLPPWDSGPLDDGVAAAAGDQLAALLKFMGCWSMMLFVRNAEGNRDKHERTVIACASGSGW